jgi:hypothetical protein
MRVTLQTAGTWLFALIVVAIAGIIVLSFALDAASDDLHAQAEIIRGVQPTGSRMIIGSWLSAAVAPDVDSSDVAGLSARSDDLHHRADRMRELAAAASVAGLVLALGTAKPEKRMALAQSASSELANTRSNGTV